jgi:hypothetical protein
MNKVWFFAGLFFVAPLFPASVQQSLAVSCIISPKHGKHIRVFSPQCASLADVILFIGKIKVIQNDVIKIQVIFGKKLPALSFNTFEELEAYLSSESSSEVPSPANSLIISIHFLSVSDELEAQLQRLLGDVAS